MAEDNKLAEVNATLDRFAKLIEENAEQLRKDKEEFNRQLAKDKEEFNRQLAEDRAKDEKRQEAWEQRFASICDQVGGQGNNIGDITEAMTVSDNIMDLVNKFDGIDVGYFSFNTTRQYPATTDEGKATLKQHEIDGFAEGKKAVVVIEAKTVVTERRVKRFLDKLARFKLAYPDHANKDLYGALTFIRIEDDAYTLAEQHGLFVIKASPPDVELTNNKNFKPIKVN